jgi:hypothetical protein
MSMLAKLVLQTLEILIDIILLLQAIKLLRQLKQEDSEKISSDLLKEIVASLAILIDILFAVVSLTIFLSLGNAAYTFWILTLNIDTYRNGHGNLRKWKKMNDADLLKSLLTHSGVERDSEVERLTATFLEPGEDNDETDDGQSFSLMLILSDLKVRK